MLFHSPMLTSDDLKKLRGVISEELDNLEIKMEHRFNAVDKRFDAVDQRFKKLEKQIEQYRKDWSTFFNHAGIFFDEMRNQMMNRIKKVEDNQRLPNN
jgi:hypothetical protein